MKAALMENFCPVKQTQPKTIRFLLYPVLADIWIKHCRLSFFVVMQFDKFINPVEQMMPLRQMQSFPVGFLGDIIKAMGYVVFPDFHGVIMTHKDSSFDTLGTLWRRIFDNAFLYMVMYTHCNAHMPHLKSKYKVFRENISYFCSTTIKVCFWFSA